MMKTKKGIIIGVHDMGSMWSIDVAEKMVKGKPVNVSKISGDWRPMRDGLDSAFDISSNVFPYTDNRKIYENVIGQEIEYSPDPIFGATSWRSTGKKVFSLKVDLHGKIKKLGKVL